MKNRIYYVLILFMFSSTRSFGQGCVAIRGNTMCSDAFSNKINLNKGQLNIQMGIRHFKSFRHFRGDEEEKNRIADGTEVINKSTFFDLSINYGITNRLFGNVILPIVFHNRSSMYEHGGNPPNGLGDRRETSSKGLSDIRLGLGYWLFAPNKHDYNYAVGLGVKLPSGKYNYKDVFYNQGINKNENLYSVVDQSIQPGDGGLGITIDLQGNHPISKKISISSNFFYLFNFKESNGILTRNGKSEFSCPDQFALRVGSFYNPYKSINLFLGGRLEGVPSKDLIGGSAGYRRPGYIVAIEPGIGYSIRNYSVFASCPYSVYRNRTQSYEDKETTKLTGKFTQGDAAFANYVVNIGLSYRFGGKHKKMNMD